MTAFDRSRGNWTMVSNRVIDLIVRGAVTPLEGKIVLLLHRLSVGVSKIGKLRAETSNGFESVAISVAEIAEVVGASRSKVKSALASLEIANILVKHRPDKLGRGHTNALSLNFDSASWQLANFAPLAPDPAWYKAPVKGPLSASKGAPNEQKKQPVEGPLLDEQSPAASSSGTTERLNKDRSKDSPLPPKGDEGDRVVSKGKDPDYRPAIHEEEIRAKRDWSPGEALHQAERIYLNRFHHPLERDEKRRLKDALASSPHTRSLLILWFRAVERAFGKRESKKSLRDGAQYVGKNPFRDVMAEFSEQCIASKATQAAARAQHPSPQPPSQSDDWTAIAQQIQQRQSAPTEVA